jgi:predicted acyl esterase
VASSQYGLPGRAARNWGSDSLEGDLSSEELAANRADQHEDAARYRFRDEEYYRVRDFDLSQVEVPLLSGVNWGAIHLHLRGSVLGFMGAKSQYKYMYTMTGRHDLPFFYDECVELQRSFLDACLKGDDREGWLIPGRVPRVNLCVRKGNPGHNNPEKERQTFPRRMENEWPLARTRYTDYHLHPDGSLSTDKHVSDQETVIRWQAPGGHVRFRTQPAAREIEITGHPMARLSVALSSRNGSSPSEVDLFLTLRHHDADQQEISYTGATGEASPIVRGWLRVSLRKTVEEPGPLSKIMPERNYYSTDQQAVVPGEIYTVDVEIWPTSVVLMPGETLELQISSSDSEGMGVFGHDHPEDRPLEKLMGYNDLRLSSCYENFLRLPIIPEAS